MIKITAIGGYGEVGRNCTLVTVDDESVIFDMGMHMDHLLTKAEGEKLSTYTAKDMIDMEIVPDDSHIDKEQVKAIIPSHGHLDHIGGLTFLAKQYHCPIYATPFTAEVIKRQFADNYFEMENELIKTKSDSKVKISKNLTVEFIHVTHSIPHAALLVLHTKYGQIVYANDFKFDDEPVIGKPSSYDRIKKLDNVLVLINECLYAGTKGRTQTEQHAKDELQKVIAENSQKGIFATTFTSHVVRLEEIYSTARALGRKVMCFGRSLEKYLSAAKIAGFSNLINKVELYPYKSQIKRRIRKMTPEEKRKYIIVITGHQAEDSAVLNSFLNGVLPNPFSPNDLLVFSCNTIPTESIIKARAELEEKLKAKHLKVFTDVHVSGHAHQDDLKILYDMTKPKFVIPSHGTEEMMSNYEKFAKKEKLPAKVIKLYTGDEFLVPEE